MQSKTGGSKQPPTGPPQYALLLLLPEISSVVVTLCMPPSRLQGEALDAEAAAEMAALLAPGDAAMAAAFGATELAPRVTALCLLRAWVEQAQHAAGDGGGREAAAAAGRLLWRQLLDLTCSDPELRAARYGILGPTHRKKVRQYCAHGSWGPHTCSLRGWAREYNQHRKCRGLPAGSQFTGRQTDCCESSSAR